MAIASTEATSGSAGLSPAVGRGPRSRTTATHGRRIRLRRAMIDRSDDRAGTGPTVSFDGPVSVAAMPTAVVTGASRGIGRAIAGMLADEGYDLCLCARSEPDLTTVSGELRAGSDGIDIAQFQVDVTNAAAMAEAAAAIGEHSGSIDVLVVNAGIGAFGPMEDFDIATFDRLFAVNVRGAFLTLQAFTPALRAAEAGTAVVVSSDVSTRVFPGGGPYSATKHAVRALTRTYQQEQPDLRVLELRPGATDTHFGDTEEGDAGAGHLTAREVAQALRGVLLLPPQVRPEELVVRSTGQRAEF